MSQLNPSVKNDTFQDMRNVKGSNSQRRGTRVTVTELAAVLAQSIISEIHVFVLINHKTKKGIKNKTNSKGRNLRQN